MLIVKVAALCVATAMICAALRVQRPEMATALSLAAGVAVLSELGAQLCADAGETALAGRVTLAARVAMLALCAPLLTELVDAVGGALA